MSSTHTIEDARALAELKGGKCLSTKYRNNISKLEWECSSGHQWNSSYASMTKNWCKKCSIDKKKLIVIKQIEKFCFTYGIICVDTAKYKTRTQILKWKCHNGHEWKTHWASARASKLGCPKCNTYWTIEDAIALAEAKNGNCLSNIYERSDKKLMWKCSKKHIFKADISKVNEGSWCRKCNV